MKIPTRTTVIEIAVTLALALLIFLGIHFTLESRLVNGVSMLPNLEQGQRVLVCKAAYWFGEPRRGDVVVFYIPSRDKEIIHRIVGLPNETVEIKNGQLYINNEIKEEPYIQENTLDQAPEIVPEDSYLIIGDNRDEASSDIVPRNEIIGKAWLCYWPFSDWHIVSGYSYQ
jgi:signal peptidase I